MSCGFECCQGVGKQGAGISEHFELDPIGSGVVEPFEDFATEPGDADGVFGGEAAGGIGQDGVVREVDEVEDISAIGVDEPFASDRHRDHLRTTRLQALLHQLVRVVLAGADGESSLEFVCAEDQRRIERGVGRTRVSPCVQGVGCFGNAHPFWFPSCPPMGEIRRNLAATHERDDFEFVAFLEHAVGVFPPRD